MGDRIEINPGRIEQHGKEIKSKIAPSLQKAGDTLNTIDVYNLEGGSFSITCTTASMAYPGAVQFAFEDLKTHLEMLDGLAKGIATTAENYTGAENANVIRTV
ncbi:MULTISPECIES: hypothetical protein [Thermomonosporaceae]|uniref:hypothetical protein n=1 Tax=Thermomonosporaceae TaxID=2012 RepID=UPI00255AE7BF|nr:MULTISPECIES: hypothetical protein [Thermomonosporaceae]MDL4772868.1 hypothetical protein [Actinomadura xylanilytica]